ncbi:transcriptional regulator with XRE-family HTH domain [Enterococcus sp. PF1-24]|uniref:helix-turn-helix transcriptional regulator n=1 Tax=unclassified Enterococcus TaxID=2608891 RepID=UPI002474321B|nr:MULTISPECIES: helix-turn-helix transcriptional regulator [unclassified Enterococcus]MDH6364898.1 transcriptional regulator with XRE-family HTH domain [Enterococcus sp. PFB1-1]MDH6401999.1 transcriptional regulator with XRE-family HTH domain [Enterococcus sp. PF1-24]
MTFGKRLKELRNAQQLTQDELAKKICVSRQSISNWENDKGQPDLANLILLSELFKLSIDELVNQKGSGEMKKPLLKSQLDKASVILLGIWSVLLVVLQIVLNVQSTLLLLLYALGGFGITINYMRKTKRLANLFGQGEDTYDIVFYVWVFFAMAIVASVTAQTALFGGGGPLQ